MKIPKLKKIVIKFQPDFVFHLAAQSLVNVSYKKPLNKNVIWYVYSNRNSEGLIVSYERKINPH